MRVRVLDFAFITQILSSEIDLYETKESSEISNDIWYNISNVYDDYLRSSKPESEKCLSSSLYDYYNFDRFFLQRSEHVVIGQYVRQDSTMLTMQKCRILKGLHDSKLQKQCDSGEFGIKIIETDCGSVSTSRRGQLVVLSLKFNSKQRNYELDEKPFAVPGYMKISKMATLMASNKELVYPKGNGSEHGRYSKMYF